MEEVTTATRQQSGNQRGIVDRVRDTTDAQLSRQKDRATEGLGSIAQAVRQSTEGLRREQHDTIANYVEQAANQLDKIAQRLEQKNVRELLEDAQRFARRQPALFIGAAFALGVVGARFFKSSSERTRDQARARYSGVRYAPAGGR